MIEVYSFPVKLRFIKCDVRCDKHMDFFVYCSSYFHVVLRYRGMFKMFRYNGCFDCFVSSYVRPFYPLQMKLSNVLVTK